MKYIFSITLTILISSVSAQSQNPEETEKMIALSIDINAPLDSVWARWTTESGRKKFFAPASKYELTTLGHMEVLFMPEAPEGQRGAENNRVLAVEEKKMLSFTWDAPPQYPDIRKQRTVVVLRFKELAPNKTQLVLRHMGFGSSADWNTVHTYFAKTWSTFVLPNLKYSLEVAPIVWGNFPKDLKPATTLKN